MPRPPTPAPEAAAEARQAALSRWDNEGGAMPPSRPVANALRAKTPPVATADLIQLRVRVIAIENVVIALLAQTPESAVARVRALASAIQPRPGHKPHPLTLHAAEHMLQLVERAARFKEIVG